MHYLKRLKGAMNLSILDVILATCLIYAGIIVATKKDSIEEIIANLKSVDDYKILITDNALLIFLSLFSIAIMLIIYNLAKGFLKKTNKKIVVSSN